MLSLIILIVVVGLVMWLVNTYLPLDPPFKTILNVVVILALCVYLLRFAGLF